MSALPPPLPPAAAPAPAQPRWKRRAKFVLPIAGALAVGGLLPASALEEDDDSTPRYTLTEAACKMLREGDTPDEAYRALTGLVIQADDAEAHAAVDRAVAQGCGS
jgi:hypothetical protein